MSLIEIAMGLAKLGVSAALAVLVVFVTYRVFIKANTDFDEEIEIKKGNTSVGILVAALLVGTANIIHQALSPVLELITSHFTVSGPGDVPTWKLGLFALAHLTLAFTMTVVAISFSLRMFGKLTTNIQEGKELHKGNIAVGVVLSGVVFVVALYIGEGINALSKSLIPQPSATRMRIMR